MQVQIYILYKYTCADGNPSAVNIQMCTLPSYIVYTYYTPLPEDLSVTDLFKDLLFFFQIYDFLFSCTLHTYFESFDGTTPLVTIQMCLAHTPTMKPATLIGWSSREFSNQSQSPCRKGQDEWKGILKFDIEQIINHNNNNILYNAQWNTLSAKTGCLRWRTFDRNTRRTKILYYTVLYTIIILYYLHRRAKCNTSGLTSHQIRHFLFALRLFF